MFLSIISPFHNSEKKCVRLLATLLTLKDQDVELVFVDDGSTDNTLTVLSEFQEKSQVPLKIVAQKNKGPGGARNTGLMAATGEYVWFVDSDDDINPDAIILLIENISVGFDFVDFNILSKGQETNSMDCSAAKYSDESIVREILLTNFGRICSKVIRREMLIENDIFYPEFCIYEDNPLVFIYPFYVKSFLKVDMVAYYHHEEFESVTRMGVSPKYFDRMATADYGLRIGLDLCRSEFEKEVLFDKFRKLYFVNTSSKFFKPFTVPNFLIAARVGKRYRAASTKYNLNKGWFPIKDRSFKFNCAIGFAYILSYFLPSVDCFFSKQRMLAWGRPFNENRVELNR